ncbi:MAG: DsbA family protein, partial [Gaiellaceae bacterium]
MASGKKSREKRRSQSAPPPVQSKGTPRRRQASPRVLIGAGAAAAVIAVVVVLIVVFTGGGPSTPKNVPKVGSIAAGLPGSREVDRDFKGIPQKGMTLGSDFAKVTMVEYVDLQCPFCQQFDTEVLPSIITKYVKTGKVKIELRVLDFIGPDSSRGRKAMLAAGNQNRAFNYAEILYFNQGTENTGWLSDDMVASAAASIPGLDVPKLLADRNSSAVAKLASDADAQALSDKVTSTPTLLVGRS